MTKLLSYPGLLVEVRVPINHDDKKTYAALQKLRREIRALAKTVMPKGVRVTVEEMN